MTFEIGYSADEPHIAMNLEWSEARIAKENILSRWWWGIAYFTKTLHVTYTDTFCEITGDEGPFITCNGRDMTVHDYYKTHTSQQHTLDNDEFTRLHNDLKKLLTEEARCYRVTDHGEGRYTITYPTEENEEQSER